MAKAVKRSMLDGDKSFYSYGRYFFFSFSALPSALTTPLILLTPGSIRLTSSAIQSVPLTIVPVPSSKLLWLLLPLAPVRASLFIIT